MKKSLFLLCISHLVINTTSLYSAFLSNDNVLKISEENESFRKIKQTFRAGQIFANYINVGNKLLVNGNEITGTTTPTSYGQLLLNSQDIFFITGDAWVAIPFNGSGPTSNVEVSTSSPATITIQQAGIYQINLNMFFSVSDSDEASFDSSTYTFGVSVNGITTPVAAVYAGQMGYFSINYSKLLNLEANDYLQFYMKTSYVAIDPVYTNNVMLRNGNAYLTQISS